MSVSPAIPSRLRHRLLAHEDSHSPNYANDRVKFEDQSWYPAWKKSLERLVIARVALDATKPDTLEREAADREYQAARVAHRKLSDQLP
jgi:hypothetical protein